MKSHVVKRIKLQEELFVKFFVKFFVKVFAKVESLGIKLKSGYNSCPI